MYTVYIILCDCLCDVVVFNMKRQLSPDPGPGGKDSPVSATQSSEGSVSSGKCLEHFILTDVLLQLLGLVITTTDTCPPSLDGWSHPCSIPAHR